MGVAGRWHAPGIIGEHVLCLLEVFVGYSRIILKQISSDGFFALLCFITQCSNMLNAAVKLEFGFNGC
jgi:hypothetical protein